MALFAGMLTLVGIWFGVRWSSKAQISQAAMEQRHTEASTERRALEVRIAGLEQAVHSLELSVHGLTVVLQIAFPALKIDLSELVRPGG